MKTLLGTLFITLCLVGPTLAQKAPQGPFILMNYINMRGENEYLMMTNSEVQERYRVVRQEKALFARAIRAAEIEWNESETSLRYPGRMFKAPELMRLKVVPRQKEALKALNKLIEKEEQRQEIQMKNEEAKIKRQKEIARRNRREYKDPGEVYKKQRENLDKAYTMLRDKMDELLGKGDTAHRRVKPNDVNRGNR